LHACKIEDGCKVGTASIVLDKAIMKTQSALAPGSLLSAGKEVPSGEVWF
jgi:carbonic anhydrase/acetyltransferase-like protein (isoleucine patch superfamily)